MCRRCTEGVLQSESASVVMLVAAKCPTDRRHSTKGTGEG